MCSVSVVSSYRPPIAYLSLFLTSLLDAINLGQSSPVQSSLYQPSPSQVDLHPKLALSPTALGSTDGNSVAQFHFVFYALPCAGAVVWEVYA
jgi:hypothetical protein